MEGLQFDTEHASTQIGHQQMILEEYTIDDWMHINYNASTQFVG
jgi:hypothetical protein